MPFLSKLAGNVGKSLILNAYLSAWFCALVFLSDAILQEHGVPYISFGFAIAKASLLSKFMMIGEHAIPLKFNERSSVLWLMLRSSIIYTSFVLVLSSIFVGIEGYFHHKGFVESLQNFYQGNLEHLAALTLCYWLIILPYLAYCALKSIIGANVFDAYLLGSNKK